MKFKVDENLPAEVAALLAEAGHDSKTVLEQQLGGRDDRLVLSVCSAEDRVLVTMDKDFANVTAYPPNEHRGLLVLRLPRQDKPFVIDVLGRILPLLQSTPIAGQLWIVEDGRVRIHGDRRLDG